MPPRGGFSLPETLVLADVRFLRVVPFPPLVPFYTRPLWATIRPVTLHLPYARRSWQQRWFVLQDDQLMYYRYDLPSTAVSHVQSVIRCFELLIIFVYPRSE